MKRCGGKRQSGALVSSVLAAGPTILGEGSLQNGRCRLLRKGWESGRRSTGRALLQPLRPLAICPSHEGARMRLVHFHNFFSPGYRGNRKYEVVSPAADAIIRGAKLHPLLDRKRTRRGGVTPVWSYLYFFFSCKAMVGDTSQRRPPIWRQRRHSKDPGVAWRSPPSKANDTSRGAARSGQTTSIYDMRS